MIIFLTFAIIVGKRNNKVLAPIKRIPYFEYKLVKLRFYCLFIFPAEEGMLYRARYFGDTDLYQRAQRARTPSCAKLSEITASLHG